MTCRRQWLRETMTCRNCLDVLHGSTKTTGHITCNCVCLCVNCNVGDQVQKVESCVRKHFKRPMMTMRQETDADYPCTFQNALLSMCRTAINHTKHVNKAFMIPCEQKQHYGRYYCKVIVKSVCTWKEAILKGSFGRRGTIFLLIFKIKYLNTVLKQAWTIKFSLHGKLNR